jgi:hypothetical protein
VLLGTEGGGLVRIDGSGATRPAGWPVARVSAIAHGRHHLWLGDADGRPWAASL